ncbi:MAG TPA: MEDS domain-containing protein [Streptosporangiaceae bacterium]|nr:MEDS domain-containing protein [Streptosporangiaceae bacterium]
MDSQVEALHTGPRDHLVLFYSQDTELTRSAGDYLLGALRDGGAAIVLGTWEHRLSLARFLVRAGVDLSAARSAGTYCELDASDTVGTFVMDSHADPASFWAAITPVLRRAADAGQPVRIFGEMVAVLWDDGQAGAAIEVEAMWNELSAQFPFSLLCAYPTAAVTGGGQSDQLADLCRAHSAVSGDLAPAR